MAYTLIMRREDAEWAAADPQRVLDHARRYMAQRLAATQAAPWSFAFAWKSAR